MGTMTLCPFDFRSGMAQNSPAPKGDIQLVSQSLFHFHVYCPNLLREEKGPPLLIPLLHLGGCWCP